MSKLSQELIDKATPWNNLFSYADGTLFWIGKRNGSRAGRTRGHADVLVNGRRFKVHRIIWEMHNGPIGDGLVIDHIDGDPCNNRIANLRACTPKENSRNSRTSSANTSGWKGVFFLKKKKKYSAYITVNRKRIHLGYHKTPELAHAAYSTAASKFFGEFAKTI